MMVPSKVETLFHFSNFSYFWSMLGNLPYQLECNPGVLFFVLGFRVRFYSNLTYLGFYLSGVVLTELKIQIVFQIHIYLCVWCRQINTIFDFKKEPLLGPIAAHSQKLFSLTQVGFHSRWGSIVLILVFDWGSINILRG